MALPADFLERAATFSEGGEADALYRYSLMRRAPGLLTPKRGPLVLCMLNPSDAGEVENDNTTRLMMDLAAYLDRDPYFACNYYAYRAKHPEDMMRAPNPVGPDNDEAIVRLARHAAEHDGMIIVAAGVLATHRGRDAEVMALLEPYRHLLHAFALSQHGHPRHPLYTRTETLRAPRPLDELRRERAA